MKKIVAVLAGLVLLACGLIFCQAVRIYSSGKKADYTMTPFERPNPSAKLKVLFLGDSTAVGTGAKSNAQSTAGWFGQDFPNAAITNISLNGRKLDGLLHDFHPLPGDHYDLAVVQIGANDIMRLTSLNKIRDGIGQLIDRVRPIAGTIVILHSGNVGLAPAFIWPFNEILTWRSARVREIYIQTARERGVLYVDLFSERSNDLFLKDIGRYYSPDLLHPSGNGYRWWYERIRQTLDAAQVTLRD